MSEDVGNKKIIILRDLENKMPLPSAIAKRCKYIMTHHCTLLFSSGKDIVALRIGANNLSFGVEGTTLALTLLVALSYFYVFDQSFCAAYYQILYLMQHFILGDMTESKGKLSVETNTVLMWMNTESLTPNILRG